METSKKQFTASQIVPAMKSLRLLEARQYLRTLLPKQWEQLFKHRFLGRYQSGNRYGLDKACPFCPERPPKEIAHHSRWRWLAVHIAQHVGKDIVLQ